MGNDIPVIGSKCFKEWWRSCRTLQGKRPSTKDAVGMRSCASDFRWAEVVWNCGTKRPRRVASPSASARHLRTRRSASLPSPFVERR
jgi:hypothetical protein